MLAIYGRTRNEFDSGPEFLKFASRLPYYQGAVRAIFERIIREEEGSEAQASNTGNAAASQTMTMAQALSGSSAGPDAALAALNQEGMGSQFGPLFEHEVAT